MIMIFVTVSSCYYDNEDDLYPSVDCNLEDTSYSTAVLPIIESNCYTCHDQAGNFGNITLEGYDALKTYVDNGQLLGAIRHEAGFSPMPKNKAQLLECEIEKIVAWVEDGAPNN